LRKEAEKTKQILSTIPETLVQVECLMDDKDYKTKISRLYCCGCDSFYRDFMDRGCKDILDTIGSHIKNVVEKAGLTFANIDSVEVIGGGMRIPSVQVLHFLYDIQEIGQSERGYWRQRSLLHARQRSLHCYWSCTLRKIPKS
jgi:hypothetical protein